MTGKRGDEGDAHRGPVVDAEPEEEDGSRKGGDTAAVSGRRRRNVDGVAPLELLRASRGREGEETHTGFPFPYPARLRSDRYGGDMVIKNRSRTASLSSENFRE